MSSRIFFKSILLNNIQPLGNSIVMDEQLSFRPVQFFFKCVIWYLVNMFLTSSKAALSSESKSYMSNILTNVRNFILLTIGTVPR